MATESRDLPELLKPSEVAARLGVSRTWLYDAWHMARLECLHATSEACIVLVRALTYSRQRG
jgi:hypothetical protein